MSRFFSNKFKNLTPYVPGEQPRDAKYIKLNTNESPFDPAYGVKEAVLEQAKILELYSDPDCKQLTEELAKTYKVKPENVIFGNGSDEILNFSFMAFCDREHPAVFADITYGFYPVFAELNGVPYTELPLNDDFSIDPKTYEGINKTVYIANPNAPTGIALGVGEIEKIVKSNPNSVVVIDEAYVDFGAESCVPLTKKYPNLLVVQTFSKSRAMAGARLGFGIGSKELIEDLHTVRFSTNPYNINRMTMAAGIATLRSPEYMKKNCDAIIENRTFTATELKKLGFEMTESKTNFVFAKCPTIDGGKLYKRLKEKGVLVRHFNKERIRDYNRITIGTKEQMEILIERIREIMEEIK